MSTFSLALIFAFGGSLTSAQFYIAEGKHKSNAK
jgi:hypothetical protein